MEVVVVEKFLKIIKELDPDKNWKQNYAFNSKVFKVALKRHNLDALKSSSAYDSFCIAMNKYHND
jgi:hypothetical protein